MIVRHMHKEDIPVVARAQAAAWRKAFRGILSDPYLEALTVEQFEASWRDIIERSYRTNLVVEQAGAVVGFVGFGPAPKDEAAGQNLGEIYGIYVHPDHWRSGAGGALLSEALARLGQAGFARVILWTMRDNLAARRFYEKNGFVLDEVYSRISARRDEQFEEVRFSKPVGE